MTCSTPGPVVPTAVEQHDLAGGRQVRDVALEVPLALLAFGGGAERDDPAVAGVEPFHDPLDGAAFAGGVATLEDDHDAKALVDDPLLHPDEFGLQAFEFLLVLVLRNHPLLGSARNHVPVRHLGFLAGRRRFAHGSGC